MSSPWLPSLPQVSRETIAVLAATVIAAVIISRWPQLQRFIQQNSVTVKT